MLIEVLFLSAILFVFIFVIMLILLLTNSHRRKRAENNGELNSIKRQINGED